MTSLLIPCYWANQELITLTKNCLNSLVDFPGEIIVIDDGSPIKPNLDYDITLVTRPQNGGYVEAVNTGLDGTDADIIILANNDLEFIQADWLDHLMKPINEGYDISLIRQTDCDGWETDDFISEGDKFGALFAMTREVLDTVGLFDERFKGYFSDLDYKKRVERAGFKVGKNHAGLVEHKGKATYTIVDPEDKEFWAMKEKYMEKWGEAA